MKLDFPKFVKIALVDWGYRDDIYKTTNYDGTIIYGEEVKMVELLSQALHFDYQIKYPEDNVFGRNLGNGTWSGVFGVLQRQECDLIVDVMTAIPDRQNVVDFSYPYDVDKGIFITTKPVPMQKAFVIFCPLSYTVWILLFFSLIIFCLLISIYNREKSKIKNFLNLFGYIFKQPIPGKFENLGRRFLLGIWIVAAMILSYGCAATLLSYMTFPKMTGVRNILELSEAIKKGTHICATLKGTYFIDTLVSSGDDNVRTCGESLLEHSNSYAEPHEDIESSSKAVAYVSAVSFANRYENRYFLSKDAFQTSVTAVGIRKGFCCQTALDKVILRIWETGLYEKLLRERKLSFLVKDNWTEVESVHQITLKDTMGAFTVFVIGHTLSTVIFILEIVYGKLIKD